MKPPLRIGIEMAYRVSNAGTELARRAVKGHCIPVKGVMRNHCAQGVPVRVVYAKGIIDTLEHKAVARAEPLVGRLIGECIGVIGESRVDHSHAVEAERELRIR